MSEPTPAEDFQEWINQRAERKAAEAAETPRQRQRRLAAEFATATENHF